MVLSLSVSRFARPNLTQMSSDGTISTTIAEALRNNPFGTRSRPAPTSAHDPRQEEEQLNHDLETLARIFPDVKIEVFRELLVRFDGNSRLHVCTEQLLRHKDEWVAGRWKVPEGTKEGSDNIERGVRTRTETGEVIVPANERFRSTEYKAAVKAALTKEFSGLSKSTVEAVLAEVNFSYMRAHPTLRDLSRKTWRATINNILPSFKNKRERDPHHPLIVWHRHSEGELIPRLKETGCSELDQELHDALLVPLLRANQEAREEQDRRLAVQLNVHEAIAAEALYECECCLSDVTFEEIATCSENAHIMCYDCIRRTIHEALFGQGWSQSIDTERSTLKCLSPVSDEPCTGSLNADVVKQALLLEKSGLETYTKFETRLASDALMRTQLKLVRCPFCSYAEVDSAYHPPEGGIPWRFRRDGLIPTILMTLLLLDLIPLLAIPLVMLHLVDSTIIPTILRNSILHLYLTIRPKKFICANSLCRETSCITCQKPWRDPHVCHEPLLLDLRATVEAARTAAVKRTCPRCGTSFVKSSGCNKLTCVCGYSMCYLCRKGLGPLARNGPNNPGNRRRRRRMNQQENIRPVGGAGILGPQPEDPESDSDEEEPEGYHHFCEHFRVLPGARCTQCSKCELYQDEDEETVARRAGEQAEREWNARQAASGVGVGKLQVNRDFSMKPGPGRVPRRGQGRSWSYWLHDVWQDGQWRMEGQVLVDWVVERVVVIDEI
ncbi:conserved hypothetical protein [Aspergillus terreus NIH2624]|uniref:RING-type domain-containing protein n=1 Tax=Aspergillus terreus (strain NIH 2624 / FGSC A1156) TaxID=341663 RepID=Q0CVR2_ASPTN|nr:uncharacterized protein ATEG_02222 [Aspergillus terreus NIH2624]EAU37184.1 conserved hypothetical protein [Aspergillus terreus NIH2624]